MRCSLRMFDIKTTLAVSSQNINFVHSSKGKQFHFRAEFFDSISSTINTKNYRQQQSSAPAAF